MSETPETPEATEEATTQAVETEKPAAEVKTPEWYEKELSKTRDEAAKYRTRLREAETKFTGAKTPEEHAAAVKELADANAKLERDLMVARVGKGLPDELAALLKGDTEEELKAHAEALRKFVPSDKGAEKTPPVKLAGGLAAKDKADDLDPKKLAEAYRKRRF